MSENKNNFPPVGTKLRFTLDFFCSCPARKGQEVRVLAHHGEELITTTTLAAAPDKVWIFKNKWQEGLEIAPPEPQIILPKLLKPTSGLSKHRGIYYALYTVDGKVKTKSLKTENLPHAQQSRDAFYTELKAKGAIHANDSEHTDPKGLYGIYQRKPFQVKVRGKYLGDFETQEEAIRVRNEHLGI